MSRAHAQQPHRPQHEVPDEFEPSLPVEPDEGPVPAHIPDDPERDRVIDPAATPAPPGLRSLRPIAAARWP